MALYPHAQPPSFAVQAGPPLLLTKRIQSFLQAQVSPSPAPSSPDGPPPKDTIHTILLITPTGKLLAHAAHPSHATPARALRTQCTVTAALWAMQHEEGSGSAFGADAIAALPNGQAQDGDGGGGGEPAVKTSSTHGTAQRKRTPPSQPPPTAVTVQLASGAVYVVRQLRCGLLFVSISGGNDEEYGRKRDQLNSSTNGSEQGGGASSLHTSGSADTPSRSVAIVSGNNLPLGSPSEAGASSLLSTGTGTDTAGAPPSNGTGSSDATGSAELGNAANQELSSAAVLAARKRAEELARLLDDKFDAMVMPDEGL